MANLRTEYIDRMSAEYFAGVRERMGSLVMHHANTCDCQLCQARFYLNVTHDENGELTIPDVTWKSDAEMDHGKIGVGYNPSA